MRHVQRLIQTWPADVILAAAGKIMSGRRTNTHNAGRHPKPTACARCGEMCPSATGARKHCVGQPRKKTQKGA